MAPKLHPLLNFQKRGVIDIKQYINGEEQPYESLELIGYTHDHDMVGYHGLMNASCIQQRNKGCMIKPHHWGHLGIDLATTVTQAKGEPSNGLCTLFMFDNIASGCADSADTLNPRKRGNCRLRFRLNQSQSLKVLFTGNLKTPFELKRTEL